MPRLKKIQRFRAIDRCIKGVAQVWGHVMRGTRSYQTPPQLCYKWSRDLKNLMDGAHIWCGWYFSGTLMLTWRSPRTL